MREKRKGGFGKLAFFEFLIIAGICALCYYKIGDGTIKVDLKNLFNFSDIKSVSTNDIKDDEDNNKENEKDGSSINKTEINAEEMYTIVREAYIKSLPFMYSTIPSNFQTGETKDGYTEILNYDTVMKSIFTDEAIKTWETNNANAIKKQNGKVYIMAADGVIGLDYVARTFVKFEYQDKYLKCKVDNMFYDDIWNTLEEYLNPAIKHVETDFAIKNVDGIWLVDKINRAR